MFASRVIRFRFKPKTYTLNFSFYNYSETTKKIFVWFVLLVDYRHRFVD